MRLALVLAALLLAGCASPAADPAPGGGNGQVPTATSRMPGASPTCGEGEVASATNAEFVTAYIEEDVAYDGGVAADFLRGNHTMRSWTDMRIIAHRDMGWTGEPGFEVVTVDATNGSTTWRLELDYTLVSDCVPDRAADDDRLCKHWGQVADVFLSFFDEAGGWSASATAPCRASGGG